MIRIGHLLGTAALALTFGSAAVLAQAPATPAAPPAKAAPAKGTFKLKTPTTAAGKECSAQADAKGLHGKDRKAFRAQCKKGIAGKKPA